LLSFTALFAVAAIGLVALEDDIDVSVMFLGVVLSKALLESFSNLLIDLVFVLLLGEEVGLTLFVLLLVLGEVI
jgi:hypothetical protein